MAQSLDKLQHSQRQEAAKQRREEKKKLEKEKMMNETDPEKTRKWEVRSHVTTGNKVLTTAYIMTLYVPPQSEYYINIIELSQTLVVPQNDI